MLRARPIAVTEIAHQIPVLPQRLAITGTSGTRDAVKTDDAIIGDSVSPAPPRAPSSTISAQMPNCEIAAMRR